MPPFFYEGSYERLQNDNKRRWDTTRAAFGKKFVLPNAEKEQDSLHIVVRDSEAPRGESKESTSKLSKGSNPVKTSLKPSSPDPTESPRTKPAPSSKGTERAVTRSAGKKPAEEIIN